MYIGNDLVDLGESYTKGRSEHCRYLNRVFTQREKHLIQSSPLANEVVWLFWSAKESVYKLKKKESPNTKFIPREFEVRAPLLGLLSRRVFTGKVIHKSMETAIHWDWTEQRIHCVAVTKPREHLYAIARINGSPPSTEVRKLTQKLLEQMGVYGCSVKRREGKRRGPPQVYCGDTPYSDIDISLSYDGEHAAAALLLRK